jgi:hypothetical protein
MTYDKSKQLPPAKALTLSEAAQLLKAMADAALLRALAVVSGSSKGAVPEKCSEWSQEG